MSLSQAVINPSRGTIRILLGTDDAHTRLSTDHLLAPWPVDDFCEMIATKALRGMGWTVIARHQLPESADDEFLLDVAPAGSPVPP